MTTVQTRESSGTRKRQATSAHGLIENFKAAEHALTLGGKTGVERVRNFRSRQEISRAMAILERDGHSGARSRGNGVAFGGIGRQAMSKAVTANRLFYVDLGARRGYPAFYADASLQRRQVEAVSKLLGKLSGGSGFLFFSTPKGSMARPESGQARTPLQALRAGDFERVKRAAAGYAQR